MKSSSCVDSLNKGQIEVGGVVFRCLLLHIDGLGSEVGNLLLNFNRVNGVEFLDLPLLFVKIHNNGLVVGLSEATDKVVVLRKNEAVNGGNSIGHIVEELTPEPVTVRVEGVHKAMWIFCRSEVARVGPSSHEDVVGRRIHIHCVHGFSLFTTCKDWELLISTGLVFQPLSSHCQGTQKR